LATFSHDGCSRRSEHHWRSEPAWAASSGFFETGFAVRFVERQKLDDLPRLIIMQSHRSVPAAEDRAAAVASQQTAKCA